MAAKKKPTSPLARATSDRVRVRLDFTVILPEPHQGIPPGMMTLMKRISIAARAVMCEAGMSERELNECRIDAGARMQIDQRPKAKNR